MLCFVARIPLTWNTDMQELSGQEVSVELLEGEDENSLHPSRAPRAVVLSHNFVSVWYWLPVGSDG